MNAEPGLTAQTVGSFVKTLTADTEMVDVNHLSSSYYSVELQCGCVLAANNHLGPSYVFTAKALLNEAVRMDRN